MRRTDSDESLAPGGRADDRFFVIATVVLPFIAQGAYIFDVFYYHNHDASETGYEGLLSSILSVFNYLQYSVPLRSRYLRFVYHLSLWLLSETGTIGHIVYYSKKNDVFHIVLYAVWATIDTIYFICLIYCRVFGKRRGLHVHMALEQEHLFHFISRLEVILAIFIPVFFDTRLITLTRDNIAFYILFDFFAESYHRFSGVRIKATLYIFVITVTVSVATEWIHIANHNSKFEFVSLVFELIAASLCYSLIVMQFFKSNFCEPKKRRRRPTEKGLVSTISSQTYESRLDDIVQTDATSEVPIWHF